MKDAVRNILGLLWVGFTLVNFVLFSYAEWLVIKDNFLAFLLPWTHLAAVIILFSMPYFWISTAGLFLSYYFYSRMKQPD